MIAACAANGGLPGTIIWTRSHWRDGMNATGGTSDGPRMMRHQPRHRSSLEVRFSGVASNFLEHLAGVA
jgi:hypothetical protein